MENLGNLIKNRRAIKAKLTAFSKFVIKLQVKIDNDEQLAGIDLIALEDSIARTENFLNDFDYIKLNIELNSNNLEGEYIQREQFEETLYNTLGKAKSFKVSLNKNNEQNVTSSRASSVCADAEEIDVNVNTQQINRTKLLTIELPKFNSSLYSWLEFKHTLDLLIHDNNTISDIQKFHYLQAALEGAAEQVIKLIQLSSNS